MTTPSPPSPERTPDTTAAQDLDAWMHRQWAQASMGLSPIALSLAAMDWAMHLGASPGRQMQLATQAAQQAASWWAQQAGALGGQASSTPHDDRFRDPSWQQWPYAGLRDAFLMGSQWWKDASQVDGMSRHHQQLVGFFARQWMDALSPSNSPLLNPQVAQSGAAGLAGMQKMWAQAMDQMQRPAGEHGGEPQPLPYAVGQDVAVTPGEVVFRNELFELIQYHPTTPKVCAEPLLIVPSTIMKYYILDLSAQNSMVKYLVDQGMTVFIMSWRNPDEAQRHWGMDDYLIEGVMRALQQVREQTQSAHVHAMGYCLGGTFLAIVASLMGWLQKHQAAKRPKTAPTGLAWPQPLPELASVTLLAAQTDFSEPGELGLFIDEDQLRTLREEMARTGYLSGKQMAGTFQFLNARDLVWSRMVNNVLLGKDDVGNDMMSWNADTTRLPERMHNEYLQQLFLDNAFRNGHYKVAGQSVAAENIRAPLMVVGTEKDHVSPWRSVFKIHLDARVDTSFILASGGHNAGIVSEPGHPHRHYRRGLQPAGQPWRDPDDWLANATQHEGSWWSAWARWLHEHSANKRVPARRIRPQHCLGAAPGTYVTVRYAD